MSDDWFPLIPDMMHDPKTLRRPVKRPWIWEEEFQDAKKLILDAGWDISSLPTTDQFNVVNCCMEPEGEAMSDVNFPDPTVGHSDFLFTLSQMPPDTKLSLRDARAAGRLIKKGRVWTIEFGQHINDGLNEGTIDVVMLTISDDKGGTARVNHYFMKEDAISYWQTGRDAGQSAEDILNSWAALQSIASDLETKTE